MKNFLLFLLGFFFMKLTAYCQKKDSLHVDSRPVILGVSFDYGFLLRHSQSLREIEDAYPFGIRMDGSKLLLTRKSWEFCNCFPRVGVSLAYWNWDNEEVLGSGIVSVGYLEPYFLTQKRTNLFVRMGLGGAYLTNPFDEVTNPRNQSYSTRLAFAIVLGAGLNYRITDKLNFRLAAKYSHISNGGVSSPNKGLNFPTVSVGLNSSLEPIIYPNLPKISNRKPPDDKTRISLVHFSGISNATVGERDRFYVFGFAGNYSRWIGGRSALTAGTEWAVDFSRREQIKLENADASFPQGALLLGHEFWLGRITFSQQLGIYYFNQFRTTDDVYQRYGLTYSFNKHLFAGFALKAHRHVADFFDLRIGYTF
ncbi:MAG: acyloxyacyl hydrolase [Bacteroidota bacterium]